ncbi:hypothetical protein J3E71DRAFT_238899 [Bipolaris maydis]|nr:hypothetical protein J3E71DRAFT_238899 [Bipolaris maydis]
MSDIGRLPIEEVLYKAIKLVYQNSPQVLSLVRFLHRYPFFTSVTRAIEINAAVLKEAKPKKSEVLDLDMSDFKEMALFFRPVVFHLLRQYSAWTSTLCTLAASGDDTSLPRRDSICYASTMFGLLFMAALDALSVPKSEPHFCGISIERVEQIAKEVTARAKCIYMEGSDELPRIWSKNSYNTPLTWLYDIIRDLRYIAENGLLAVTVLGLVSEGEEDLWAGAIGPLGGQIITWPYGTRECRIALRIHSLTDSRPSASVRDGSRDAVRTYSRLAKKPMVETSWMLARLVSAIPMTTSLTLARRSRRMWYAAMVEMHGHHALKLLATLPDTKACRRAASSNAVVLGTLLLRVWKGEDREDGGNAVVPRSPVGNIGVHLTALNLGSLADRKLRVLRRQEQLHAII